MNPETKNHLKDLAKRALAACLVLQLSAGSVFAAAAVTPAFAPAGLSAFPAADHEFLVKTGGLLGIQPSGSGADFVHLRKEAGAQPKLLDWALVKRVFTFISRLPKDDPEQGLALALRSYLAPRMDPRELDDNMFVKRGDQGRLLLTDIGRNALVDILTASDGQLLEPMPTAQPKSKMTLVSNGAGQTGSLAAAGAAALQGRERALQDPAAAFDGRGALGSFDWSAMDRSVSAGGLKGFTASPELSGYRIDADAGTVRVIVAARRSVGTDHFGEVGSDETRRRILAETGLDDKLFASHGAKVVRAVDNLVTVDVPLADAAALGLLLRDQGIESRPAKVFRAAATALQGPALSVLGGQFLPVPLGATDPGPKLVDSRSLVGAEGLTRAGMRGKGTTVGIIDSGIDMNHPDMKDAAGNSRVSAYMDFTKEGQADVIGHGTHVAGTIGGSGAASDGKYQGLASQTRFKVAKVFGEKGETDESVLLAAMKWMASQEDGGKVDVLNMSLGGPGAANIDPLSAMANQLAVKENILVVAAAGNEGPWAHSVGAPGNSRYALTVGGVDKQGEIPFFSSRGPILGPDGKELYVKPDLLGISGDVDLSAIEGKIIEVNTGGPEKPSESPVREAAVGGLKGVGAPVSGKCVYAPGVVAPRSSSDRDNLCTVDGSPGYRYMSGTSMATPMVSGMSADVIGYLKEQGADYSVFHLKALMMETSRDLGQKQEDQGAGLVSGTRLAQTVLERVQRGIPVGNIAFELAMRLTGKDREGLKGQTRYQMTALGLLDTQTGHLVNDERKLEAALAEIRSVPRTIQAGWKVPRIRTAPRLPVSGDEFPEPTPLPPSVST